MARKKSVAEQTLIRVEPAKRDRNGPLSLGTVVQRLIDLDRGFDLEVESALNRIRSKLTDRKEAKRKALLARLPSNLDRDQVEAVVRSALGALLRKVEPAPAAEQVAVPGTDAPTDAAPQ